MIIDTIDNLKAYAPLNPLFKEAADFIATHDLASIASGSHTVIDGQLTVKAQTAHGKSRGEAVLEYHRQMVDIQIPLSGPETYGYTPVADLPACDFDEAKDIAFAPGVQPQTFVTVNPGQMAIFFPADGHAPCITDEQEIKKVIIKVRA